MPIELKITGDTPADIAKAFAGLSVYIAGERPDELAEETAPPPPAAPVPVAPVPVAPPPAAPVPVAAVVLDGAGLPHDGRIHSKDPKLKADGHWRTKRGIATTSPGLIEQVTAELRATYPAPVAAAPVAYPPPGIAPPPPAPAPAPVAYPPAPAPAPVAYPPAPAPAPVAYPPAPAPAPLATVDIAALLSLVGAIMAYGGNETAAQANAVRIASSFVALGLPPDHTTNDLLARPDLYPAAQAALVAIAADIGLVWPPAPAAPGVPA